MYNDIIDKSTLISIIIPTHNRAHIIKQCIDSILNQTYKEFELIIVDDHSEDNTIELLNTIIDSRLKIINLKGKKGAQAARNEGIKNASGEWICFNDSDDFWRDDKLEINMDYLKKNNYEKNIVFYTNCYKYNESSKEKTVWNLPEIKFSYSYKSLLAGPGPMFQGLFFHKSLIINSGLLDEDVPAYQEWDTSLILAKSGAKFCHIKEPLFTYNLHSGETISKDIIRGFNGYQYILNKYKDDILRYCGIRTWKKHIKFQYNRLVNDIFLNRYTNQEPNIIIVLANIETYFLCDSNKTATILKKFRNDNNKIYILLKGLKRILKNIFHKH
jgi:glycosyltransferase involved in cell wall biosynthesis